MTEYNGYEWSMEMCLDSDQELHIATFSSKTEAIEWLRENHPGFFRHDIWRGEGPTWFQFGTDYYWATFTLTPKPVRVAPAPWYTGGHLLAPSGTMSLPDGYLGRWCCACGAILERTSSGSEAFEKHLADLRRSDTLGLEVDQEIVPE